MSNQGTLMYICFFMAIYSVVNLKIYLGIFFKRRQGVCGIFSWLPFLVWQFLLNTNITRGSSKANLILTMGSLYGVVWGAYYGDIWKKWVIGPLFLVLCMLLEAIIQYGVMFINPNETPSLLLLSTLSKILLCLIVLILRRQIRCRGIERTGYRKDFWMVLLPAGSIALYYALYKTGQTAGVEQVAGLLAIGTFLILLLDLSSYPMDVRLMEEAMDRRNSCYYIRQLQNYQKQKEFEEQAASEIRETRHDLKQKLIYIREMAERGDGARLRDVLSEMIGEINERGKLVCETGNYAVDALVNCKAREVEGSGGRLHTDVRIARKIGVLDEDISVLLGNALDNASEALEYVEEEKREIWLEMREGKGVLLIRLKNRYDGNLERDSKGNLKSRKSGKNHGIGLFSIEKIVKKYYGEFEIFQEENIFCLEITMYGQFLPEVGTQSGKGKK